MKTLGCSLLCACEFVCECAFFGCCYFFCQFFPFVFGCRIQFAFFGIRFSFIFAAFFRIRFGCVCIQIRAISYVQRILQRQCRTQIFSLRIAYCLRRRCSRPVRVHFYPSWLLFLLSIYVQFKSFLFLLFLISLLAWTVAAKAKMMP